MKRFLIISFIYFCAFAQQAQVFTEFNSGFNTIFINPSEINSYHFGFNPAMLDFGNEDELLAISSDVNIDDGNFKRFIDPLSNRFYQLIVSGKKTIDSTQRFNGSFGFHRKERRNWNWVFTRDYHTGNPFLIGDSTSGDSRINGITMNTEYSNKIFEDFSLGFSLAYTVDEMLKEISPRPTSAHRDIHSRIGVNYSFTSELDLGLIADVYDNNEEIAYREDEGSITQETIILKFKGYDFPNVFRKKTETRYSYTNGYAGGITFSYTVPQAISTSGYCISGFYKKNIKDDAIDPRSEGFWMNNFLDAGLQMSTLFSGNFQIGLLYKYHRDDGWAKYPPYKVLYFERVENSHSFTAGVKYTFDPMLKAGIEGGIRFTSNNERDYYSAILSNYKSNIYFGKAGLGIDWSDNIFSIISYGYSTNSVPEYSLILNDQSNYFANYRINDFIYNQTESNKHEITLSLKLVPWFGGYFYVYLNYAAIKPQIGSEFQSNDKVEFNSTIEYRVKVF